MTDVPSHKSLVRSVCLVWIWWCRLYVYQMLVCLLKQFQSLVRSVVKKIKRRGILEST